VSTKKVRCAIYTRKSSDEGLDQDFNSLHAQREACEAYILSQRGEGWSLISTAYDDGGFSGGNLERPAMKALMADVEAGRIDVVVVYKVDRLTRSLTDFARIVEAFDRKTVSFVSITQSFNTTTSMGRLTLNVLLSFAQFEREVTGERIRDKIAASKAKGMWMGGRPALGYDFADRKLAINPAEADVVRHIFQRYLELKAVNALCDELDQGGVRSKAWATLAGKAMGGCVFTTGSLFHLLKSRLYVGEIVHKDNVYPGLHAPIIDRAVFDAVQAQLAANAVTRATKVNRSSLAPLKGLIFDAVGRPMSPSFGYGKGGRSFHYYVSIGARADETIDVIRRVSATQLDALIAERLGRLGLSEGWPSLRASILRVELRGHSIALRLKADAAIGQHATEAAALIALRAQVASTDRLESDGDALVLTIGVRPVFRGGRTWLLNSAGAKPDGRPAFDRRLIAALKQAHHVVTTHGIAPTTDRDSWRTARSPEGLYNRKIAALAFLAPDIQQAILEGRQPPGLTFTNILERGVPAAWAEQRRQFGF
jgi:site-specific DNA recombinase